MNSTNFDDPNHEYFALETVKCIENIFAQSQKVTALHKELQEFDLTVTAYIKESKIRLDSLRLDLAHAAKSSHKVVEILSDKSLLLSNKKQLKSDLDIFQKMTSYPKSTPKKKCCKSLNVSITETNNNSMSQFSKQQSARNFAVWYKCMADNDRTNLTLYLSDDVILEWFGKTIRTKKKVSFFMKYDMHCCRHDFTTIESIDMMQTRYEASQRKIESMLASPLHSPDHENPNRPNKRRWESVTCSPQWAEGCRPHHEDSDTYFIENKRAKVSDFTNLDNSGKGKDAFQTDEVNNKGDGISRKSNHKFMSLTPTNKELGQGDCLPSTSGTTSSGGSRDTLNIQLTKLAVECNGYIEFTRMRNERTVDSMKWDRKCKLQIRYSEDPLNVGEYIIWALSYSDESKCRRNLLHEFQKSLIAK